MALIPYQVRIWLQRAWHWGLWAMADVPVNGPRVSYSPQITLGNIIQILMILAGGVSVIVMLQSNMADLTRRFDALECSLVAKNVLDSTTGTCTTNHK